MYSKNGYRSKKFYDYSQYLANPFKYVSSQMYFGNPQSHPIIYAKNDNKNYFISKYIKSINTYQFKDIIQDLN